MNGLSLLVMGLLVGAPWITLETGTHSGAIRRIDVDAAGTRVLTASEDGTARLWSTRDGALLMTLRPPLVDGAERALRAAALSPDGRRAVVGWKWRASPSSTVCLHAFDTATGQLEQALCGIDGPVEDAAFSPDGRYLAVALRGPLGVRVLNVATGKEVARDGARDSSYNLAFLPDGRLVSTSFDGMVRLYAAGTFAPVAQVLTGAARPYDVAVAPDGQRLVVAHESRPLLELRRASDLGLIETVTADRVSLGQTLSSVAFADHGRSLVAGGTFIEGDKSKLLKWTDPQRAPTEIVVAHNTVMDLHPVPDGVLVAAFDPALVQLNHEGHPRWTRSSRVADLRRNRERWRLSADAQVFELDVAPTWERASGAGPATRFSFRDRRLTKVNTPDPALATSPVALGALAPVGWRTETRSAFLGRRRLLLLPGERALSVAVQRDGQAFALGADFTLRYFDRDGTERWSTAAPGPVWGVDLPSTAPVVAAALGDGTVRLYARQDGRELLALAVTDGGREWAAWTPSGYFDASPAGAQALVWVAPRGPQRAPVVSPLGQHRSRLRPDVVDGVLAGWDEAAALQRRGADAPLQPLPSLTVVSPEAGAWVDGPTVQVRVRVDGHGARFEQLEARWDGRAIGPTRGFARRKAVGGEVTLTVPTPHRDALLTVVGRSTAGAAASAPVPVRVKRATKRPGRLLWLAVGVGSFDSTDIPTLTYPAVDAQGVAQALDTLTGRPWSTVEGTALIGRDATGPAITTALAALVKRAHPDDLVVVFLAGHGVLDEQGEYRFLLAGTDPKRLAQTSLSTSALKGALARLKSRTLVLLDTCHSGDALGAVDARRSDGVSLALAGPEAGLAVMAASSGRQVSLEDPSWGHGAFTKALLEGLGGQARYAADGRVTLGMLELYVSERVRALTGDQQTPVVAKPASVPDFVIVGR